MKKLLLLPFLFVWVINVANAQAAKASDEDIVREIWGMALEDLTASALQLKQREADKFWPIWKTYRDQRKKIVDVKMKYISAYADNYENMTNEKAAEITRSLLKNEKKLARLKSKYFKKIKKAVSGIRAAQFIQLETTIDNEVRAAITESLPLVPAPKQ